MRWVWVSILKQAKGPTFERTSQRISDCRADLSNPFRTLMFLTSSRLCDMDAVRAIRRELKGEVPLIGLFWQPLDT